MHAGSICDAVGFQATSRPYGSVALGLFLTAVSTYRRVGRSTSRPHRRRHVQAQLHRPRSEIETRVQIGVAPTDPFRAIDGVTADRGGITDTPSRIHSPHVDPLSATPRLGDHRLGRRAQLPGGAAADEQRIDSRPCEQRAESQAPRARPGRPGPRAARDAPAHATRPRTGVRSHEHSPPRRGPSRTSSGQERPPARRASRSKRQDVPAPGNSHCQPPTASRHALATSRNAAASPDAKRFGCSWRRICGIAWVTSNSTIPSRAAQIGGYAASCDLLPQADSDASTTSASSMRRAILSIVSA